MILPFSFNRTILELKDNTFMELERRVDLLIVPYWN